MADASGILSLTPTPKRDIVLSLLRGFVLQHVEENKPNFILFIFWSEKQTQLNGFSSYFSCGMIVNSLADFNARYTLISVLSNVHIASYGQVLY